MRNLLQFEHLSYPSVIVFIQFPYLLSLAFYSVSSHPVIPLIISFLFSFCFCSDASVSSSSSSPQSNSKFTNTLMKYSLAIESSLELTVWEVSCALENMTLKASQACAACKYQRRRCSSDCPLAPYFPPDQPKLFQNAHKLFGRSNILSIIKHLDPEQKAEAMRSIIHEANIRDRFPVHGGWGVICQLRYQIYQAEEELHAVLAKIEMYRQHHYHQQQQQISTVTDDVVASQLELAMAPPHNSYSSSFVGGNDWTLVQNSYAASNNINGNSMAIQQDVVQDCDELHQFFDNIDDRQSYIDSKEACESSLKESLKDTTQSIEQVAENELKTAAAYFSLTSVN